MRLWGLAIVLAGVVAIGGACDRKGAGNAGQGGATSGATRTLTGARQKFVTKPRPLADDAREPVVAPPPGEFTLVKYPSAVGELPAYLSVAPARGGGGKRPGIVWICGGDCNSIGPVWGEQPADNDQTAAAFRQAGVVMLFPTLRGGNTAPGRKEGFLGEVDDVIAAGEFLARQPGVDPERIYLGGHSTGGTLALLTAECSERFRAVFSLGPVDDVSGYGQEMLPFDAADEQEVAVRSPIHWLGGVRVPTFVIEGTGGRSNYASLISMRKVNRNGAVRFIGASGATHFDVIRPVTKLLAGKVVGDVGQTCGIEVTAAEVDEAWRGREK